LSSSRGARRVILDYLLDMSAVLRSGLLALEPLTTVFRGVLPFVDRFDIKLDMLLYRIPRINL